jgi:hypothetical protein
MKTNLCLPVLEPTEAEIQHTAYMLWLESGRLPDRELDNWLAAKEMLRHQAIPSIEVRRRRTHLIPPPIPTAAIRRAAQP